ncbi:MAG: potassium channel protein [Proteobacteria bacterium]|nr:potassium channel protein [Desulfobacula sp.]MBU4132542.1 potassium channel protein [Pseudomonadota bacterium]
MGLKKRIYLVVFSICLVIMGGSVGYYLLFGGQAGFMDCVYMTVISLTTVGYGEVIPISGNWAAEVFTMCLIIFGMGIILYGISMLTATIIEGELSGILRKKRMLKKIKQLQGHFIVCGGGRTGLPVLLELSKNMKHVVLIEEMSESIEQCKLEIEGLLYVQGDGTDDNNLEAAGIRRAAGIIITFPLDKDNLYVTMTARMMNEKIRIISRMTDRKVEPKLYKAGANGVVSPDKIGALRLASEMIRPTVVDFLDSMLRSRQGELRINQLTILGHCAFVGKSLAELGLKTRFALLLLGIKERGAGLEFDPPDVRVLSPGMDLIVMGRVADVEKADKWINKTASIPRG